MALLFGGALIVVLATAPQAAEDPYTTPAGERPLPWEYDYEDVASYWAQRWAPGHSGHMADRRMPLRRIADSMLHTCQPWSRSSLGIQLKGMGRP